jgi:hypothetical protein
LKKPEENWVWNATGRIDMHMPDRWGYLLFSDSKVGTQDVEMAYPHDRNIYKQMWIVFYAQQDSWSANKKYLGKEELGLDNPDMNIETTEHSYQVRVDVPSEGVVYVLNNEGHFWKEQK